MIKRNGHIVSVTLDDYEVEFRPHLVNFQPLDLRNLTVKVNGNIKLILSANGWPKADLLRGVIIMQYDITQSLVAELWQKVRAYLVNETKFRPNGDNRYANLISNFATDYIIKLQNNAVPVLA